MKQTLIFIFLLFSLLSVAQTITVVGDSAQITVPSRVEFKPVEDAYDEILRDTANIKLYIAELQKNLAKAQARLAARLDDLAVVRTRALEIKGDRNDREFLQGAWVLTTTNGTVVTADVTITGNVMSDGTRTGTITFPTRNTFRVTGFFATAVVFTKVGGEKKFVSGAKLTLTKPGR